MAFSHIYVSPSTQYGSRLHVGLDQLESSLNILRQQQGTMTMMIDGDGSDAAQFTEMTAQYGFVNNASAKAAWDELNSLLGKLTTDLQVVEVHAALVQAFNKFR